MPFAALLSPAPKDLLLFALPFISAFNFTLFWKKNKKKTTKIEGQQQKKELFLVLLMQMLLWQAIVLWPQIFAIISKPDADSYNTLFPLT